MPDENALTNNCRSKNSLVVTTAERQTKTGNDRLLEAS